MIAEFSVVPVGGVENITAYVAEVVETVHRSGLPYMLTPSSTIVEGSWDELLSVLSAARTAALAGSGYYVMYVKFGEEAGAGSKIEWNVDSVREHLGHPVMRRDRTDASGPK